MRRAHVLATWATRREDGSMRIVFMGTPDFAVPSLQALAERHEVSLVVTRPDAVRGRGRRLEPSPVKEAALALGIAVLETSRMDAQAIERIASENPDVMCVAAYGAILPDDLLGVAPLGCVNVHASLLPQGRGAAPIQRAVLDGDEHAGVSIMRIVHELDAGPYCRQASVEIGEKPCAEVMRELAELGARELCQALEDMAAGQAEWTEQDNAQATYAAKVRRARCSWIQATGSRSIDAGSRRRLMRHRLVPWLLGEACA